MSENIKQKGLNVTITFDDEKLRKIVNDLIINQGLEQVVHCKECVHQGTMDCPMDEQYADDYCSYGARKEQEHE